MRLLILVCFLLGGGAFLHPDASVAASSLPTFDGVARASRIVHLGAAQDGLIVEVTVDRGAQVHKGQILAKLDQSVSEKEVALARHRALSTTSQQIAEAKVADLSRQLKQQEMLLADGIAIRDEVVKIRTELRVEELNLLKEEELNEINALEFRRAAALLDQGLMKSPVNGVVMERFLSPGEVLSRSGQAHVVTLAQLDPLYIELHVPIQHLADIQVGDMARVQLDAPGNPQTAAKITIKDQVVDTASRTFGVRLELANPNHLLPAGLRCQVTFEGGQR